MCRASACLMKNNKGPTDAVEDVRFLNLFNAVYTLVWFLPLYRLYLPDDVSYLRSLLSECHRCHFKVQGTPSLAPFLTPQPSLFKIHKVALAYRREQTGSQTEPQWRGRLAHIPASFSLGRSSSLFRKHQLRCQASAFSVHFLMPLTSAEKRKTGVRSVCMKEASEPCQQPHGSQAQASPDAIQIMCKRVAMSRAG